MGIYTSRYSNKELADGKYYCVGISIGTPKFKLAYRSGKSSATHWHRKGIC